MSKKIIFFCRGEDCLDVFAEKMNKIFSNFASVPRQNAVIVIDHKEEHKSKTVSYLCGDKCNNNSKI